MSGDRSASLQSGTARGFPASLLCRQGRDREHYRVGRELLSACDRCRGGFARRAQRKEEMSEKNDLKSRLSGNKPGIDAEAIRALSDLLAETGLTEIEVEQNGARIRVARAGAMAAIAAQPVAVAAAPVASSASPAPSSGPHPGAVTSPM